MVKKSELAKVVGIGKQINVGKDRSTTGESITYVVWRNLALQRRAGRCGPGDLAFDRVGYGEVFGENWLDKSPPISFTLL
jgi:hypothetical protein